MPSDFTIYTVMSFLQVNKKQIQNAAVELNDEFLHFYLVDVRDTTRCI